MMVNITKKGQTMVVGGSIQYAAYQYVYRYTDIAINNNFIETVIGKYIQQLLSIFRLSK